MIIGRTIEATQSASPTTEDPASTRSAEVGQLAQRARRVGRNELEGRVLVNDDRKDDRSHPKRQPDSDQADLLVTPADGAQNEGDESEDQEDRAQGQAGEAAGYKLRKGLQRQSDTDQVRLLVRPADRGNHEDDQSDDQKNLS